MSRITFGLIGGRLGHSFSAPIHRLGITDYALYSNTKEEVASLFQAGILRAKRDHSV